MNILHSCMNLWAYAPNGTVQLGLSVGVMRYLNQFQLSIHRTIITITSLYALNGTSHFFHEKCWQGDISPQGRERVHTGSEKELIHLANVISWSTNDHRLISSCPAKIDWMGSQLVEYLRIKGIAFGRTYIC